MKRRRTTVGLAIGLAALLLSACDTAPTPTSEDASVVAGIAIGCLSFEQAECEAVAEQVLRAVPPGRGKPFSMVLQLFGCPNGGACAMSLVARNGQATIEFPDGGEPISLGLAGPPEPVTLQPIDSSWSGQQLPRSARVVGRGPFELQLGHCGLTWMVDFDGSFWVPVGQVDGGDSAIINAESGQILLLGPNLAVFTSSTGFTAGLQRFPGPKRVFLCD